MLRAAVFLMMAGRFVFCCSLLAASMTRAAESAPPKPSSSSAPATAEYFKAGFEILGSFPFNPPEPDPDAKAGAPPASAANQIPATVKALDGKKVVVTGYMLPLKMAKGLVTEFLLLKDQQACCYGATPQINEFVVVKMAKGVKAVMDTPVEFYGRLIVKEVFEEGFLSQIYTLEGEKIGKSAAD